MGEKIVVGMSGGVDSSMTLVLLKQQGWEPVGVSLKLTIWEHEANKRKENVCCTDESLEIARHVCKKMGVPYHIYDVRRDFKKEVMGYFISDLKQNRTPNPCVVCNRKFKYTDLFKWAHDHDIKYVATGHYARIEKNKKTGEYELLKAKDPKKDQSYGLSNLKREWLPYIKLPLGDYTKEEVYELAKKNGFPLFLKRKQSQDLCFVSKKALPIFIKENVGENPGDIVDTEGKVIGKHKGLHFYTIGQKRRLYLPGEYYVKGFNNEKNQLIVTLDVDEINRKDIELKPYNFVSISEPTKKIRVSAKVGYGMQYSEGTIYPPKDGSLRIVFDEAKPFVRAGQFCVFYRDEVCLGTGAISEENL